MNTRQIEVARGNHAFYYVVVPMAMCNRSFAQAFLDGLYRDGQPVLFPIEHSQFSGYVEIDTTDIRRNCSHGSMADAIRDGMLGDVALKMPRHAEGEMNTDVTIIHDIYKFQFNISKYERDGAHGYEPIEDPNLAEDGEKLGRFANLKVTIVPSNER